MSSFVFALPTSGWLTAPPGNGVLKVAPPVYPNETSTAQSRPIAPPQTYAGLGIVPSIVDTSGQFANTTGWSPSRSPAPTPTNPAAPTPTYPQDPAQQVANTSPWLWVGIAATAVFLFYVVKHHA